MSVDLLSLELPTSGGNKRILKVDVKNYRCCEESSTHFKMHILPCLGYRLARLAALTVTFKLRRHSSKLIYGFERKTKYNSTPQVRR